MITLNYEVSFGTESSFDSAGNDPFLKIQIWPCQYFPFLTQLFTPTFFPSIGFNTLSICCCVIICNIFVCLRLFSVASIRQPLYFFQKYKLLQLFLIADLALKDLFWAPLFAESFELFSWLLSKQFFERRLIDCIIWEASYWVIWAEIPINTVFHFFGRFDPTQTFLINDTSVLFCLKFRIDCNSFSLFKDFFFHPIHIYPQHIIFIFQICDLIFQLIDLLRLVSFMF